MRAVVWCMLFVGIAAGASFPVSAAESTAATRTVLTVRANDAGPRTRAMLTARVAVPDQGVPAQGVVNFRAEHTDLGSAVLDSEGKASLQTDILTEGSHQVVAVYQGMTGYATSTSDPEVVKANVSTVAGYTVATAPSSLSTTDGGFISSTITVTPVNGFSGYVNLSCTGLPIYSTCTFTPVSVAASCTTSTAGVQTCTPGGSVMQIQTLAPSGHSALGESVGSVAFVVPMVFGLLGLGGCRRRAWSKIALGVMVFAAAVSMTGCAQRYNYLSHGPPNNTGTPTGTFTVTVEAQSSTGSQTTTPPVDPQITLTITPAKT